MAYKHVTVLKTLFFLSPKKGCKYGRFLFHFTINDSVIVNNTKNNQIAKKKKAGWEKICCAFNFIPVSHLEAKSLKKKGKILQRKNKRGEIKSSPLIGIDQNYSHPSAQLGNVNRVQVKISPVSAAAGPNLPAGSKLPPLLD